jgi:alpha-tubulin suppressor-like RCC1 family protein
VTVDGTAYCWGAAKGGVLGDGRRTGSRVPVRVAGAHRFTAISAGGDHTCAVAADSAAYCWGENEYGQLGNGTRTPSVTPVRAAGGLKFVALTSSGGFASCGLTSAGDAYCWGMGGNGSLGAAVAPERCGGPQGELPCSTRPVSVGGSTRFVALSRTLGGVTCALTAAGEAYCWGDNEYEVGNQLACGGPTPPLPVGGSRRSRGGAR